MFIYRILLRLIYNYRTDGGLVLDCPQIPEDEPLPILREDVEAAVKTLQMGKSAVDNVPAELVKEGGDAMIDVLTPVCNKILKTGEWPNK